MTTLVPWMLLLLGTQSAPTAKFDAVSIKLTPPNTDAVSSAALVDPSEWRAEEMPLVWLIDVAYGISYFDHALVAGLPPWAYSEYFDIAARILPSLRSRSVPPSVPLMLQAMLADRFQLKVHWESRPMQAVALTIAPGGAKLQRDTACERAGPVLGTGAMASGNLGRLVDEPKDPPCGTWSRTLKDGNLISVFHGVSMGMFAGFWSRRDLPVVDQTHLPGAYDFTVSAPWIDTKAFTPEQLADFRAHADQDQQQVFITQLGLDLDYGKTAQLPVPVLVVDQAEKPTPN